jgi:hypothetical protein
MSDLKKRQFQHVFPFVACVQATVDPGNLVDGAGEDDTVTVTGAKVGDIVLVGLGVSAAGITVTAYVSAANTVSIRVQNESGGTLNLASSVCNIVVLRPRTN